MKHLSIEKIAQQKANEIPTEDLQRAILVELYYQRTVHEETKKAVKTASAVLLIILAVSVVMGLLTAA